VAACFSRERQELHYFISHPEQVSFAQIVDAAAECGTRPKASVDAPRPQVRRGPARHRTGAARFRLCAKSAPRRYRKDDRDAPSVADLSLVSAALSRILLRIDP
jgi:hypothetical protein